MRAVEILGPTDAVLFQHGALIDLAEVLQLAGRDEDARTALGEALALAESKRSTTMQEQVRALLERQARPSTTAPA